MRDLIDIVDTAQLDEAVGQSLLYHGTPPDNAEGILHTNVIASRTEYYFDATLPDGSGVMQVDRGFKPTDKAKNGRIYGVSLTRNPRFARKWKSGEGIVFTLDRTKLVHNHRMVNASYWGDRQGRDEAEEFVVGPITGVDKLLVSIDMTQATFDELTDYNDQFGETGPYALLLNHPLLRIDGQN